MVNKQGRRFLITINNPLEKNITHDFIQNELSKLTSIAYYCISDEIGDEGTYHTHVLLVCTSCLRFTTLKRHFPTAHIDAVQGTSAEARDYVLKIGKWLDDEKRGTQVPGTQVEWGELPKECQGARTDLTELYEFIKNGLTNVEIIERNPEYLLRLTDIDRTRQTIVAAEYRDTFRKMEVKYIWGETGAGKTRYVMGGFGYTNVYRVSDYQHPYDGYQCEDVLALDEFISQVKMQDILNLLDGYPLTLPCRYANRQACFTKVFIISNLDLREQYRNIQTDQPEVRKAFIRRIHSVIKFSPDGTHREYPTHDYLYGFIEIDDDTPSPFDGDLL